jgi:dolichyl-phosphate beta-glucosyltransferase
MARTTVVVPCFNEAARLPEADFAAFLESSPDVDLLFVNDGSTDQTEAILQRLAERYPKSCRVRSLGVNRGKAEAVRDGICAVFDTQPRARYVGFWDADLATSLDAIPCLASVLDERPEVQMVFGARVKLLGRSIERSSLRHYPGRVFATVVSILLRLSVYDTQCGAKLFRATDEVAALFAEPFATRWIFDVEILARFIQARRRAGEPDVARLIYEYPLEQWKDIAGSKLGPADFALAIADLARIYTRYLRR